MSVSHDKPLKIVFYFLCNFVLLNSRKFARGIKLGKIKYFQNCTLYLRGTVLEVFDFP